MNPKSPVQVIKAEKAFNLPVKMARAEHVCELEFHRLQLNIVGREEVLPAEVTLFYQPEKFFLLCGFDCYSDEESREMYNEYREEQLKRKDRYLDDKQTFIYLSENRMAHFAVSWGVLAIRDFHKRCSCIEDVYNRIIFIVENNRDEIEQMNDYKWCNIICLDDYLKSQFFYKKGPEFSSAIRIPTNKLNHVSRQNGLWRVELEGYAKMTATLILKNKQENLEEPLLLSDDYYKNRRRIAVFRASYIQEGLPIPEDDYEVLEVWVNGVKQIL